MKKADWVIVIVLISMGLACLIVSASSFRGMSFPQMGRSIGQACLSMIVVVGIIGVVYWLTQRNKP